MGTSWSAVPCGLPNDPQEICDGRNFFKIVALANSSPEGEAFVKASQVCNGINAIEAAFHKDGENCVVVLYRMNSFHFRLVEELEESNFEKRLTQHVLHLQDYLVPGLENSMETVTSRFIELFDYYGVSKVRFGDPDREIHKVSFPKMFFAFMMWIEKKEVSKEELDFVGENFKWINSFYFCSTAPMEYKTFPLRYPIVVISNRIPLTADDLLQMKCEFLDMHFNKTSTTEINRFVKYWLAHKLSENVEEVIFNDCVDMNDVYSGLELRQWDPYKRGQYFHNSGEHSRQMNMPKRRDCSKYMDIVRDDGLMASINFDAEEEKCVFVVWKQRWIVYDV